MNISSDERQLLRELAHEVRAQAERPVMAERARWWIAHNALRPVRPMVLCYPEGAWDELLPDSAVRCTTQPARRWERTLRSRLIAARELDDDNVTRPFFDLPWRIDWGDHGVKVPMVHGDNRGSYHWDPPIKDLDRDFSKLRFRQPRLDRRGSVEELELAREVLGDILPVRRRGGLWWSMGLTQQACFLMGLEELMLAVYDNPEGLRRLMAFLRDDHLRVIEWAEREGLVTPMNEADYAGSGGVCYTDELPGSDAAEPAGFGLGQRWGFAESQETVGLSPEHFAQFVLPYQLPLLEKFGLNCYGCCEQLDHRIDVVMRQVPRLRRVSVAPLANQEVLRAKLDRRYIFSRKVDPTKVCVGFDEAGIRAELRQTLRLAGDGPLELILKDTHTVQGEPGRLGRWVRIAREEVDRYLGA